MYVYNKYIFVGTNALNEFDKIFKGSNGCVGDLCGVCTMRS